MTRALLLAALAATTLLAGPALAGTFEDGMPFVKAWAYAKAIDAYCFPPRRYDDPALGLSALYQARAAGMDRDAARADATLHLRGTMPRARQPCLSSIRSWQRYPSKPPR